jgi:hypothetical protein
LLHLPLLWTSFFAGIWRILSWHFICSLLFKIFLFFWCFNYTEYWSLSYEKSQLGNLHCQFAGSIVKPYIHQGSFAGESQCHLCRDDDFGFVCSYHPETGLHDVDFLFDSLQLVDILHSVEPADFPDWRIDPLIRMLQDYTRDRNSRVLKIDKQFNCIADSLARLTFSSFHLQYLDYVPSCSYEHSDLQCPLIFQEF